MQGRGRAPDPFADASSVCTANAATPGASIDATAATSVWASSNSSSSNRTSRTSEPVREQPVRGGQCHLAVGSSGQRRHVVHLMVDQPRQRGGTDISLPGVPFGFLQQPNMRPEQWMDCDQVALRLSRRRRRG